MTDRSGASVARPSVEEMRRRLLSELGLPSRLGYTALLLGGLAGATVVGSLLATEPDLPARTRVAFSVMVAIGVAWSAFASWVLARRRVLFASHRVVAARMAVVFSGLFTAGACALRLGPGEHPEALSAMAVGGAMLAIAVVVLLAAHARLRRLEARRHELERLIAAGGGR